MKAPKYVIYTDHVSQFNSKDEYIEMNETKFIDVYSKVAELANKDDTIYSVRIYEVVNGTRCKEYKRIANVKKYNTLETNTMSDTIERHNEYNTVWFE